MRRRTKVLDDSRDSEIAVLVTEVLQDQGYTVEEAIPGLVLAVLQIAEFTLDAEASLDEAANLLADGLE